MHFKKTKSIIPFSFLLFDLYPLIYERKKQLLGNDKKVLGTDILKVFNSFL